MSKLTSEAANRAVGSQFDLVLIAARRARELRAGWDPLVETGADPIINPISIALEEIEQGLVGRDYLLKPSELTRDELRASSNKGRR